MLTNENIVCISSIDWDFIWQGHQEIMSTLAAHGNRVLFIENTGIRAMRWSDIPRLRQRLINWCRSVRGFRQERPNLYLYSPLTIPLPYSRLAQWINRRLIMRDLRQWMQLIHFDSLIVWTFLPTPLALGLIRDLNPKLVVYYCIDNFAASSPAARKIRRAERRMLEQVALVFVTSQQLLRYASTYNANVHWFPFGVNIEAFAKARLANGRPVLHDIEQIPSPRIGYIGGIHRWVDLELLHGVATRYPNFHFVLVGPLQTDVSVLKALPNVHLLGPKPHEQIPEYISAFDVGLIPYRLTEYTDHVYPTKMNEYLAMGKPVISTPLREVKAFNERYGPVVVVASGVEALGRSIEEMLTQDGSQVEERLTIARDNSWQTRIEMMSALIEQAFQTQAQSNAGRWPELLLSFYRRTQRRVLLSLATIGLCVGVLFYSPLPWLIASPLRFSQAPHVSDIVVVLGAGVGESGKAGQGYEERIKWAVELFRAGYAKHLLFSSGYTYVFREAEVMKALAVALGVPAEAILLEDRSRNTYEQIQEVSRLLDQHGWHSLLLISSPYHMRRVSLVINKQAPHLEVTYTPVEHSGFYAHDVGATPLQWRGILHEYVAIAWYRLKGWL